MPAGRRRLTVDGLSCASVAVRLTRVIERGGGPHHVAGGVVLAALVAACLVPGRAPLPARSVVPAAARPAWWIDARAIHRGARDFATGSCISCHALAGVSISTAALNLTHEGRRRAVPWLLHELAHPTSQRPPIPDTQVRDIAAYLASRR